MDRILPFLCNGLSCFAVTTIMFQFMDDRYKRSGKNRNVPSWRTSYFVREVLSGN